MKNKIMYIICKILTFINKVVPKKNNMIVLYSNLGFRDNVEALYTYLIDNNYHKKYKIIVSSNDYKNITHITGIKYIGCKKGILYFLVSKFFFYSFGKYNIMPSKKQCVVNLWHGMPLKKIGNMESGKENIKYDYFNYIISTSKYFDKIMMKSFKCDYERIMNVGQPRTDYFYKSRTKLFENYNKIAIWMPTFRVSDLINESNTSNENYILPFIKNKNDFNKLNSVFKKNNSLLLIKLHPIQSKVNLTFSDKSNIKFIDEEYLNSHNVNLYSFLAQTDMLITDYSSVYFDYLLINKPILFTLNDLDDYKKNRGLNFENLEEIMPGPKIFSYSNFINELNDLLKGKDEFCDERKKVNRILNEYANKENCKKICDLCGIKGE